MKNIKEFPKFQSLAEESDYWEKHSIADFWDILEDVEFEISDPPQDCLVLHLGQDSLKTLRKAAKEKNESIQNLAKHWIHSLQESSC